MSETGRYRTTWRSAGNVVGDDAHDYDGADEGELGPQFIDVDGFRNLAAEEGFEKENLDSGFVEKRTELLTRGFKRLLELRKNDLPITEYPLPEFHSKYA